MQMDGLEGRKVRTDGEREWPWLQAPTRRVMHSLVDSETAERGSCNRTGRGLVEWEESKFQEPRAEGIPSTWLLSLWQEYLGGSIDVIMWSGSFLFKPQPYLLYVRFAHTRKAHLRNE